jgi:heavy metal sensor kinase
VNPLGLRSRLTLIFSLIFGGILVLIIGSSYRILQFRLDESLREELRERAAGLNGYIQFENGKPQFQYNEDDAEEAFFVESGTRFYRILDETTGDLVDQSRELDLLDLEEDPKDGGKFRIRRAFWNATAGTVPLRFYNEVLRSPDGHPYLFQVGSRRDFMDAALRQFSLIALFVIPTGLGVAAVAGWWVAGRALKPVNLLAEAAKEIGISDLDRRLPLRGTGDEIDRLSVTFNDMFTRLGKAIGEMKQFTSSISHELRTPLTALRGEAEVLLLHPHPERDYRRVLASHLEEYERLTRLINKLLTLARAETGDIRMNFQSMDLARLTRYLVEQLKSVAASKQVTLSIESKDSVIILGDPDWLETAILNLIDNAVKYTQEEGFVAVRVTDLGPEGMLEIRDTGIGIPGDALPHIFERFYRVDPSRNNRIEGTGLGLNLVQWIIEQHHGRIDVQSEPDRGSCFTVWLPLFSG